MNKDSQTSSKPPSRDLIRRSIRSDRKKAIAFLQAYARSARYLMCGQRSASNKPLLGEFNSSRFYRIESLGKSHWPLATLLEVLCGTGFGLGLKATLREWPRCANNAGT
ncbi:MULTISPECIES: hypothetical protein [unclassified Moorena]|uniref:hypothetical protein n=1 Tax=unclassified Moorena TaxID=2683338 RepID=UPI0013BB479A|nr:MULTISPECIES: hypothetical protein [unclassified Moorena]NEO13079.1 hypothetical protein [Moorena sp. SIO3E8]NEP98097.1 hypothetical protein [Moorena sp. SIO3F7]NEQ62579.1 hypothetical protein [Moorena sp. SIO4A1]NEQ83268.1 hypothetical protein [Moorena sp. SIO2I5]